MHWETRKSIPSPLNSFPLDREFREHMLEDMDDVHSVHSVGVVENPLYAEQEDYGDGLEKKGGAEVCIAFETKYYTPRSRTL